MRIRTPLSLAIAATTAAALALAMPSPAQTAQSAAPSAGAAAAFNQAYSTKVSGEVLHLNALSLPGAGAVADAGVGISTGTTSGSPGHAATAESRNLDLALLGGGPASLLAQAKQTAPPDNAAPVTQTSLPLHLDPLVELDVSKASAHARTATAPAECLPGNTSLSTSTVNTTGLKLLETGPTGSLAALPGTAKTVQASALVPNSETATGGRDVVAAVSGSAVDIELLGGQLQVSVIEAPTLVARATGKNGGATIAWDAPLLKITAGGTEYPLPIDGSPINIVAPNNPLLGLTLQLGQLHTEEKAANGTRAAATASVLNVAVTLAGIGIADLDVYPFSVEAVAPVGGVKCGPTGPTGPPPPPTDTDGGGVPDDDEVDGGTDPNDPSDDVPPSMVQCKTVKPTIVGTNRSETLVGTPGRDVFHARAGNDRIRGMGGNDFICAGWGNDRIDAGDGNDVVFASRGFDIIMGGDGSDRIAGRQKADRIDGGSGHDYIYGGRENDRLQGKIGNDRLYGNQGADRLRGGAGTDKLVGGPGKDFVRQ